MLHATHVKSHPFSNAQGPAVFFPSAEALDAIHRGRLQLDVLVDFPSGRCLLHTAAHLADGPLVNGLILRESLEENTMFYHVLHGDFSQFSHQVWDNEKFLSKTWQETMTPSQHTDLSLCLSLSLSL